MVLQIEIRLKVALVIINFHFMLLEDVLSSTIVSDTTVVSSFSSTSSITTTGVATAVGALGPLIEDILNHPAFFKLHVLMPRLP